MALKAVIFDMDGVLVDSEGFWAKAELEVFSSYGVQITDELAAQTKYMTTKEVTEFWYGKFPWENLDVPSVEHEVVSKVIELIQTENCTMSGIQEFVKDLKNKEYKIGLATNAPLRVADAVLEKLQIRDYFDTVHSSEFEEQGKPHPAVYLTAAQKLEILPEQCIAIEDSHSGLKAAKAAGMKTIVFTNNDQSIDFEQADFKIKDFKEGLLPVLIH
ncbi:hexitol phosphatase HxpB [Chryseobacterium pennae]|uniref:Hexitol phosphatase HxpB n=1 Tax=Chryseobacterium pennae TaxID=2258962 RepID=A0A3D9C2R5_9FLAO|nr:MULTISPECIES: hexitol phosphatase HxpB [Chryseobacterium]MCS4304163.1 sugar-phosphatase [Chryseobacterium sp. BIGb0232]REC59846.1 hexitol phosphatase HxpB [Chryseobacterium pennae]ROS17742.1 sugar-phosphatase [Chryseobacterium nakagawai]